MLKHRQLVIGHVGTEGNGEPGFRELFLPAPETEPFRPDPIVPPSEGGDVLGQGGIEHFGSNGLVIRKDSPDEGRVQKELVKRKGEMGVIIGKRGPDLFCLGAGTVIGNGNKGMG